MCIRDRPKQCPAIPKCPLATKPHTTSRPIPYYAPQQAGPEVDATPNGLGSGLRVPRRLPLCLARSTYVCLAPPCMCTKWLVCLHTRIWPWGPAVSQLPCSPKPMQARKIVSCPFPFPLFDCRVESYFATIASAVTAQNT